MSHFVVTVEVKETIEAKPIEDTRGYPVKSGAGSPVMTERRVIDRLRVVIADEDETDAIRRAMQMLVAANPAVTIE